MRWFGFLAAALLAFAGAWAVTHPDAWYRGAGGFGSGLTPATRRVVGWSAIVAAVLFLYIVVPRVG